MKVQILLVVLVAVFLTGCTRESPATNERQIDTPMLPVNEPLNTVIGQTLPSIEPASGVTEQKPPTTIERACATAVQDLPNSNSSQRWVHGSWVDVQATPTANATVLTHLPTNTPVQVSNAESKADYCEITWSNGQHGFIACRLLGSRPLTIEDLGPPFILVDSKPKVEMAIQPNAGIDRRYLDWIAPSLVVGNPNSANIRSSDTPVRKPNPNYFPTCAFWIEPNLGHLLEAGSYFEDVILTPEQKDIEDDDYLHRDFTFEEAPPLPRFKIAEFEAMKDLMKKGLIAPPNSSHPRLHRPATVTTPGRWSDLKSDFRGSLANIKLQPVSVSHFKSLNEIGRPSAGTEELSSHFQIPYSIDVVSGPSWERDEEGLIFKFGSWDIGVVRLFLTEPLLKHTISNRGVVSRQTTSAPSKFGFHDSTGDECQEGFQFGGASIETLPAEAVDTVEPLMPNTESSKNTRKARLPKKIQVQEDSPLFYFYTRKPLVVKNAPILRGKVTRLTEDFYPYEYASTKYTDVNEDNVFDFAVWEGMRPPTNADGPDVPSDARPEPNFRMIFANVGGEWYLIDADDLVYICGDAC